MAAGELDSPRLGGGVDPVACTPYHVGQMASRPRKKTVVIATVAGLVLIIAVAAAIRKLARMETVGVVTGAVIAANRDPHLQRPIGNATVTVRSAADVWNSVSETSGLFRLRLDPAVAADEMIDIRVEHPDYQPLAITTAAKNQIYVLRLTPVREQSAAPPVRGETPISNVRVRYATRTTTTTTVGTAVRPFDISNTGNVPCGGKPPCSPDGKWKAAVGSISLETGEHNKHFRNVRVTCIAGPCPFSRIDRDGFSRGGESISVSVRDWSDSVTWLVEAEVAVTMESELIRYAYPVTFGRSMNFTLPPLASGQSIEADVDGTNVVFPLGPQLRLSWAACRFEAAKDGTKQYRCELKPGYRFQ